MAEFVVSEFSSDETDEEQMQRKKRFPGIYLWDDKDQEEGAEYVDAVL